MNAGVIRNATTAHNHRLNSDGKQVFIISSHYFLYEQIKTSTLVFGVVPPDVLIDSESGSLTTEDFKSFSKSL